VFEELPTDLRKLDWLGLLSPDQLEALRERMDLLKAPLRKVIAAVKEIRGPDMERAEMELAGYPGEGEE
jgi:hypothetical protein